MKSNSEITTNILIYVLPISMYCIFFNLSKSFFEFIIFFILSIIFWPICGIAGSYYIKNLKKEMEIILRNHIKGDQNENKI